MICLDQPLAARRLCWDHRGPQFSDLQQWRFNDPPRADEFGEEPHEQHGELVELGLRDEDFAGVQQQTCLVGVEGAPVVVDPQGGFFACDLMFQGRGQQITACRHAMACAQSAETVAWRSPPVPGM
jgi:hypothetical protein